MEKLFRRMFFFMMPALAGCSVASLPPTPSEIVGTYMGRYRGGVETFELRPDGTFSQTFQIGSDAVYSISGKWRFKKEMTIEKKVVQVNRVDFEPFMVPSASATPGSNANSKVQIGHGSWIRDPVRLEIGAWPYFVVKVRGDGASTSEDGFKQR
jgi:hypothetical protein